MKEESIKHYLDKSGDDKIAEYRSFFCSIKTRQDIVKFGLYVENHPDNLGKDPFPLFHRFADGMYTREMHVPKGALIVGAIHKNEYFVNILKGRILVVNEFGIKDLQAPCSFTSRAGVKNIGYIIDDLVWIDTHKTDKTTIEEAEKDIFVDSYEELDNYMNVVTDFSIMAKDIGLTEDRIKELSYIETDMIKQPIEDAIEVMPSEIDGFGVFVTANIEKDSIIGIARINNNRTPLGRYANHSDNPNAICEIDGYMAIFKALADINKGSEITVNYRNTIKQARILDRGISCQQ